ncbi:hypothetical protein J6590_039243, partial [Homalodisca vitripennis]
MKSLAAREVMTTRLFDVPHSLVLSWQTFVCLTVVGSAISNIYTLLQSLVSKRCREVIGCQTSDDHNLAFS